MSLTWDGAAGTLSSSLPGQGGGGEELGRAHKVCCLVSFNPPLLSFRKGHPQVR